MRRAVKNTIYVVLTATGLMAAYLEWAFWEPSNIAEGSIVYWLKVPAVARQFPLWNASGETLYEVRIADGEKPSVAFINYRSSDTLDQLLSKSRGLGFGCQVFKNKDALCEKNMEDGSFQQIGMTERGDSRRVSVLLGGY